MRSKKEDAQKRKKERKKENIKSITMRRLERPKTRMIRDTCEEAHKDGRTDGEDDDEAEERHALRHDDFVVVVVVVEQWYYNTSLCPRAR